MGMFHGSQVKSNLYILFQEDNYLILAKKVEGIGKFRQIFPDSQFFANQ